MNIRVIDGALQDVEVDALVVAGFEEKQPAIAEDRIGDLYSSGEFSGKALEFAIIHRPGGFKAKRLVLGGAGKPDKFTSAELRNLAGAAVRHLKPKGARTIALALEGGYRGDDFTSAAVEGAIAGDFEPDQYKTDPKKNEKQVDEFIVIGGSQAAAERGRILGESQNYTRTVANEPPNKLTPLVLADRARALATEQGLDCEVLDRDRMRQLGMGALLGVAQGSAEPPALIILRYKPIAGSVSRDHLGLVGKGVTFDTGGISIKPADNMEKMKFDMCGGAAALGAMRAIAQLKPAIPVTALIPAVENMPGSRAQRPGDIVTALSGKTIEVINTDAEGRLILADALTYAQRIGCTHLVDAATLTGSVVIALGHINSGMYTSNPAFQDKVMSIAKAEGEKMWAMPMDDEYREGLKNPYADIQNIGGRPGGSITAAWFLKEFTGDLPWVHLDIAGTAWLDDAKPWMAKGPTGVCVRTFAQLAMGWSA
jgi:leucyl aminopeptidase